MRRLSDVPKPVLIILAFFTIALIVESCAGSPQKRSDPSMGIRIFKTAESQIGVGYRFGGKSPKEGFDCSGFAWWTLRKNGINIPRESDSQFRSGKKVSLDNLMPGDLVFFETYKRGASHVGVYDGSGGFIHSPNSGKTVCRTSLDNSYFKKRYLGARRYW